MKRVWIGGALLAVLLGRTLLRLALRLRRAIALAPVVGAEVVVHHRSLPEEFFRTFYAVFALFVPYFSENDGTW